MYDPITMRLNADPMILSALKEDITSEDVTTNSVMPKARLGEVDLICKEAGVICGLDVFARVFELLDDEVEITLFVKTETGCLRERGWRSCAGISARFCPENARRLTICSG